MKYKYLRIVIACLFTVAVTDFSAFAQIGEDYVITQKKDTIKCNIKKPFWGGYDKYQATEKDKFTPIKPVDIKEYKITHDSVIYEAVILPGESIPEFVSRVESGKIKLYVKFVRQGTNQSQTTWYARKGIDSLREIKTNGIISMSGASRGDRKKAVMDLFADNPEIAKYYADKKNFNFDTIRDAVQRYNAAAIAKQ